MPPKNTPVKASIILLKPLSREELISRARNWYRPLEKDKITVKTGDNTIRIASKGLFSKFEDEYRGEAIPGLGTGVLLVLNGEHSWVKLVYKAVDNILVVEGEYSVPDNPAARKAVERMIDKITKYIVYGEAGDSGIPLVMRLMRIPWQFG